MRPSSYDVSRHPTVVGSSLPGIEDPPPGLATIPSRRRLLVVVGALVAIAVIVAIVVPTAVLVAQHNSNNSVFPSKTAASDEPSPSNPTPQMVPSLPNGYQTTTVTTTVDSGYTQTETSMATIPTDVVPFVLPLGYYSVTISKLVARGHSSLCSYKRLRVPYTYTIYPSINRGSDSSYTAYWEAPSLSSGGVTSLSDVGNSPATTNIRDVWSFEAETTFTYGGCDMGGYEALELAEDGSATYFSGVYIDEDTCKIDSYEYKKLDACELTWWGVWRS